MAGFRWLRPLAPSGWTHLLPTFGDETQLRVGPVPCLPDVLAKLRDAVLVFLACCLLPCACWAGANQVVAIIPHAREQYVAWQLRDLYKLAGLNRPRLWRVDGRVPPWERLGVCCDDGSDTLAYNESIVYYYAPELPSGPGILVEVTTAGDGVRVIVTSQGPGNSNVPLPELGMTRIRHVLEDLFGPAAVLECNNAFC